METLRDLITAVSTFLLPLVIVGFPVYGLLRKVPVYETFVAGAKDGFTLAITILPYLVAILFAFGMFRASGALEFVESSMRPMLAPIGVPAEIMPMAIVRPLSGSGSLGVLAETVQKHGRDSEISAISGVLYASTETTFYVLAVYFGAVGIRKTRHAVPVGLIADLAAVFLAVLFVKLLVR